MESGWASCRFLVGSQARALTNTGCQVSGHVWMTCLLRIFRVVVQAAGFYQSLTEFDDDVTVIFGNDGRI